MSRLEEIRQRLEAATPGPWFQEPNTGAGRVWVQRTKVRGGPDCEPLFAVRGDASYKQREHDAALIVHAPEDIALLLEVAEAALEVRDYRHATSDEVSYPIEMYTAWHRLGEVLDKLTVEIPE